MTATADRILYSRWVINALSYAPRVLQYALLDESPVRDIDIVTATAQTAGSGAVETRPVLNARSGDRQRVPIGSWGMISSLAEGNTSSIYVQNTFSGSTTAFSPLPHKSRLSAIHKI